MGNTFQSVAVRSANAADIKTTLARWLSHKGYELSSEEPLFDCDPQTERGLCLFSNEQWTVVLYSHQFEEGERLLHELHRHPWPVLQIWVYDSDIWGYDLFHDGDKVAAFNSDPRYFGAPEPMPFATNGDPELLCELCKLGPLEDKIYRLQRQRALFRETVCRQFCMALGVSPAGLGYRDVEENEVEPPGVRQVDGFQMDHMRFVLRGSDRGASALPLHVMPLPQSPPAEAAAAAETPPEMAAYIDSYQRRVRILMWFIRPFVFVLMLCFRFYFWLRRVFLKEKFPGEKAFAAEAQDEFYKAFYVRGQPSTRLDGNTLINDRYRCRITLPGGVESMPCFGRHHVFCLRLGDTVANCGPVRPDSVSEILRMPPGARVLHDDKFMAGPLQARQILRSLVAAEQLISYCSFLIQTPRVVFHFLLSVRGNIPAEQLDILRRVVDSFQMD